MYTQSLMVCLINTRHSPTMSDTSSVPPMDMNRSSSNESIAIKSRMMSVPSVIVAEIQIIVAKSRFLGVALMNVFMMM